MYQVDSAADAVCNGGSDFICDWLYDVTENETLAEAASWIVERPFKVILILVVAYFLNRIVRRAIARAEDRMIQDRERKLTGRPRRLRTADSRTWSCAQGRRPANCPSLPNKPSSVLGRSGRSCAALQASPSGHWRF